MKEAEFVNKTLHLNMRCPMCGIRVDHGTIDDVPVVAHGTPYCEFFERMPANAFLKFVMDLNDPETVVKKGDSN